MAKMSTLHDLLLAKQAEESDSTLQENAVLQEKSKQDDACISELEGQVASLKASQAPLEYKTLSDPETPRLHEELQRAQQQTTDLAQSVTSELDEDGRCRVCVRLVMRHGHAARRNLCHTLGVDSGEVQSVLNKSLVEIQNAVSQSRQSTPYVRLLQAVAKVRDGQDVKHGQIGQPQRNNNAPDTPDLFPDFQEDFTPRGSLIR